MITVPVAAVREIMGDWANTLSDADISSASMARMIEAEIQATCDTWLEIVDPEELEKLDTAIAYLAAARLASSIGGIKSMTLGDQMITLNSDFIAKEQSRWRRDALALIGSVCPVVSTTIESIGIHFGVARGRRG